MSCDSANDRAAPRFRLSSLSANGPFKKPAVLLAAAALLASAFGHRELGSDTFQSIPARNRQDP